MTDTAITPTTEINLGTIHATSPDDLVYRATAVARTLAKVVADQRLYSNIKGRKYVKVEGWNTLGAMLGIVPREVDTSKMEDGGYLSIVELVRVSDGAVIGRGSAIVGMDEKTWSSRDEYARRSMAITRATGKAFRIGFSWIMALAGFEATPAEEMVVDGDFEEVPPQAPPTATERPKSNGTKAQRPLDAEGVRKALQHKSATYSLDSRKASDKQRKLLIGQLSTLSGGDDGKRYTFTRYTLEKASSKDLLDGDVLALLDWLALEQDEDGQNIPSQYAIQEFEAVLTEAYKEEGQKELI